MSQAYTELTRPKDKNSTPQTKPLKGRKKEMRKNNAGGWGFKVDKFSQLHRFLLIGSAEGTYYVTAKDLTKQNLKAIQKCLDEDYTRAVDMIVDVSQSGQAAKNDPALFALAIAASHKNVLCRKYALSKLNTVARITIHLFIFHNYIRPLRGRGRTLNRAFKNWYQKKYAPHLAYQIVKYRQREGMTHRDMLRICKPKPVDSTHDDAYAYAVDKMWWDPKENTFYIKRFGEEVAERKTTPKGLEIFEGFERAKHETKPSKIVKLIKEYSLTHEMIPNGVKEYPAIWEAMLPHMPLTATIRNLGKMTNIGLIAPMSNAVTLITKKLQDKEALQKARIHPLNVLVAYKTYDQGKGFRGSLQWSPIRRITDALEDTFYKSFDYVEPSGKRTLIALDVSGSMEWLGVIGIDVLKCCELTAAMSMVTARTEENYHIMGFASSFRDLNISRLDNLETVMNKVIAHNFGSTNVAAPMDWAAKNHIPVDTFVVYTDNETWTGRNHPVQALNKYRKKMGINARNIFVAAAANNVTCADPNDSGMLDICGFSSNTPAVITQFSKGEF